MERREFLKVAFGFAAGAAAISSAARAAPMVSPSALSNPTAPTQNIEAKSALANQRDLDEARVEEVRWGRRRGWGRRRWGFRRRRFWGVRRRYWRRRWYRRRYW